MPVASTVAVVVLSNSVVNVDVAIFGIVGSRVGMIDGYIVGCDGMLVGNCVGSTVGMLGSTVGIWVGAVGSAEPDTLGRVGLLVDGNNGVIVVALTF